MESSVRRVQGVVRMHAWLARPSVQSAAGFQSCAVAEWHSTIVPRIHSEQGSASTHMANTVQAQYNNNCH